MITFHVAAWRQLWGILTSREPREDLEREIEIMHLKYDNRQRVLFDEIKLLSALIDQEYDETRKHAMCIALQALQWARNPYGFSKPSVDLSTMGARLAVTPGRPRPDLKVVK